MDEVVVLFTFFVTDDLAPNGRHLRVQTRTVQQRHLLLDPARGEEKSSEIRQHDGVMTDAVEIAAGLRRAPYVRSWEV